MSSLRDTHPGLGAVLARLDELQTLNDALESALDWLPIGYVLVTRERRVLKASRAAKARIQRRDGLTVTKEILDSSDETASGAFREAIWRASDGTTRSEAAAGIVHLPRERERPLTVILVAVEAPSRSVDPTTLVALLIPEGEVGRHRTLHVLRDLYRLTPREVDIASDLLQGHRVNDIARQRALSVHTVRTHLKRLLEKTQTSRQSELLSLMAGAFPPVERQ